MNFRDLISPSWWFNLNPNPLISLHSKIIAASVVFLMLVIGIVGIFLRIEKKKSPALKKLFSKLIRFGFTLGIVGLIFLFADLQFIPLISARFWWGLWTLGAVLWAIGILRFAIKAPAMVKGEKEHKEKFEKYLRK